MNRKSLRRARVAACAVALLTCLAAPAFAADHVKIGTLFTSGGAPLYIAIQKGYFQAEGIEATLVPFDAGQPVAVATVAGSIDFGSAGFSSALYTLAAKGEIRIIGGASYDRANFPAAGILASNAAYAAGLRSMSQLTGHSVGLTQVGSTYNYALAVVADKFKLDLSTIRGVPLQSFGNVASAVSGGQVDAGIVTAAGAAPLLQHDKAKLLGWVGEESPWQVSLIWTTPKMTNEHANLVKRVLAAMRKGAQDAHDAFVGPGGTRKDGPTAPEVIKIMQNYVKLNADQIDKYMGYCDPQLRIDMHDVQRQLNWYHAEGMLKQHVNVDQIIDKRYAVALPGT
jgi:NitT/TauT family transport system substrate-binding protein